MAYKSENTVVHVHGSDSENEDENENKYLVVHASESESESDSESDSDSETESDLSDNDSVITYLTPFIFRYTLPDKPGVRCIKAKEITKQLIQRLHQCFQKHPTLRVIYVRAYFSPHTNEAVCALTNLFQTVNFHVNLCYVHTLIFDFQKIEPTVYNAFLKTILDQNYFPFLSKLSISSWPAIVEPFLDLDLLAKNTSIRTLHVGDVSQAYYLELIKRFTETNFTVVLFSYDLLNYFNVDNETFNQYHPVIEANSKFSERNYHLYCYQFINPFNFICSILNSGFHANYTILLRQIFITFLLCNMNHTKTKLSPDMLLYALSFLQLNSFKEAKLIKLNDY